jgi:hypothetical protein
MRMAEGSGQEKKQSKKEKYPPGVQARRLLRNARQEAKDGEPTPKAQFLMQEAGVLATLDLADAMREQRQS